MYWVSDNLISVLFICYCLLQFFPHKSLSTANQYLYFFQWLSLLCPYCKFKYDILEKRYCFYCGSLVSIGWKMLRCMITTNQAIQNKSPNSISVTITTSGLFTEVNKDNLPPRTACTVELTLLFLFCVGHNSACF